MTMTQKFAILVLLLVATTGVVTAQELPDTPTPTPTADNETVGEQIDANTRLVSATYNPKEGTATIVIESDTLQEIVVSDAGAFVKGGVVPQREATATPGEQTTLVVPVTETDRGFVGVSIATRETLYAVPIKTGSPLNPWSNTTSRDGWIGGISVSLCMVGLAAWRAKRTDPEEPEAVE